MTNDFHSNNLHYQKAPAIWIVIADQKIARIFKKSDSHLELICEASPIIQEHNEKDTLDDFMGRIIHFPKANPKLQTNLQPGRRNAINFAEDLSQWLKNAAEAESYDRLILIAAPRTLGDLRPRLHKSVQNRIAAEVNKELTNLDYYALKKELREVMWF